MKTKLTLTVQKEIIEKAKKEAKDQGVSLSKLFEKKFGSSAENKESKRNIEIDSLVALLDSNNTLTSLPKSDREIYHRHLEEKYG